MDLGLGAWLSGEHLTSTCEVLGSVSSTSKQRWYREKPCLCVMRQHMNAHVCQVEYTMHGYTMLLKTLARYVHMQAHFLWPIRASQSAGMAEYLSSAVAAERCQIPGPECGWGAMAEKMHWHRAGHARKRLGDIRGLSSGEGTMETPGACLAGKGTIYQVWAHSLRMPPLSCTHSQIL